MDVAREAGVSYATVSRVVNGKAHVRPEKRERVLQAMERLGYVANQQARSLAGGRSQVIGLLVPDLGSSYIGEIIRGIDQELEAVEYELMLYTTHRRRGKESSYVAMISRGLTDGLLLVAPTDASVYLSALQQRGFPYVLVDPTGADQIGPSVGVTNRQGAFDATRYLIDLGHTRIGFISGRPDLVAATERRAGFRAALQAARLPICDELIREGDFNQPGGYRAARDLLTLAAPPTAIFASNDVMAFGAAEAAREHGLRIPHDISIIGFDDIPQAAHVYPPLTTVRQPLEAMGRAGARILLQQIGQVADAPTRVVLQTELVIRQSCRAPCGR